MRPELKNGDVVLVNRLVYNAMTPKRGDIMWLSSQMAGKMHIIISSEL